MKHLKTSLLFSFALLLLFNSCKKDDEKEIKDYNYFKVEMSNNRNILKINSIIIENTNILNLSPNGIFTTTNNFKLSISDYFSDKRIKERNKEIIQQFQTFLDENPDFEKLKKSEKLELLTSSIRALQNFNKSTFNLKTNVAPDCMAGFNHSANACSSGHHQSMLLALLDDPMHWASNLAQAEIGYRGCLGDAADSMVVCQNGGYQE